MNSMRYVIVLIPPKEKKSRRTTEIYLKEKMYYGRKGYGHMLDFGFALLCELSALCWLSYFYFVNPITIWFLLPK